ncbi:hypothetical protein C8D77_101257 [Mesorhizobium loti]|uniref:Uncharacterized protein n=1 Tax=Rhizobium loti TaxID=381 RepID=A0A8E3B785_RHILI|nr:hypothetical protein [Mesorhizobium loti]PWJ93578.1 hypothetical protein C8D77_101257 [Mesorhizobium loti]
MPAPKHTPAPWNSFNSLGELGVRTFGAGNTIVASKPTGFASDPDSFRVPDVAEAKANFRLIDAAPEMLAALHVASDALAGTLKARGYVPGSSIDGWAPEVQVELRSLVAVRAAISKAWG